MIGKISKTLRYIAVIVAVIMCIQICSTFSILATGENEHDIDVTEYTEPTRATSIFIHVQDTNGNPIPNAIVYVYPQRYTSTMYPCNPSISSATGNIMVTGLTAGALYGVNIIANNYAATAINHYISPSNTYQIVVLQNRASTSLFDPISGFSPISIWPHNSSLAHVNACSTMCSTFSRICPHTYMNVEIPQNFGWRYDVDSRLEFHQGIDVAATTSTVLKNIFPTLCSILIAQDVPGCGNTVQIRSPQLGLYATYMHLSSISVSEGGSAGGGTAIGYCGDTDAYSVHMHLSLSYGSDLYVSKTPDPYDSNILNWNSSQIIDFIDPLAYLN